MNVRVLFFALARDLTEKDIVELPLRDGATVADLRSKLLAQFPSLATILPRSMIAINQQYASDEQVIPPQAEVACIPPVSGG